MSLLTSNPLPAANSRRPFCFRRLREIRCPSAWTGLGSPAAVAEGARWQHMRILAIIILTFIGSRLFWG